MYADVNNLRAPDFCIRQTATRAVSDCDVFVNIDSKMAIAAVRFCLVSCFIIGIFCFSKAEDGENVVRELQFCSFFNNRAPTPQPGLKNCTWFKENSCCLQQEIEATFGRMKPLKGASLDCQKYVNYLMCYICAPSQNVFYSRERLTVCESFCDSWYDACSSAILKGSVIRDLYNDGREFCDSRSFEVSNTGCFDFDIALDIGAGRLNSSSVLLILAMLHVCVLLHTTIINTPEPAHHPAVWKTNQSPAPPRHPTTQPAAHMQTRAV